MKGEKMDDQKESSKVSLIQGNGLVDDVNSILSI